MKFLAFFFVIVISISSVLPSSGEETVNSSNSDYIEGDFHCPVDIEDGLCVVESHYCPVGYKFLEDQEICARATEPLPKLGCDDGFTLDTSNNLCIRESRRNGCPQDWLPLGRGCGRAVDWRPLCRDTPNRSCSLRISMPDVHDNCKYIGYRRSADKKWCEFQEGSSEKLCLEGSGFDIEADKCISNIITALAECVRGETRSGNECVKKITRQPKMVCPTESDSDVQVEDTTRPVLVCLEGTMNGSNCQLRKSVLPVLTCPRNFSPDSITGKCKADVVTTTDLP